MWKRFLLRVRSLFRRNDVEQELGDELHFHLERQIELNIRAGMPVREARAAALRTFGGVEQVKEECRDARGTEMIETLFRDLRQASRMLRKSPALTAVVVLSLGLGIGGNTAIFTLIDAVMLKALPVQRPGELVLFGDGRSRGFISGITGTWNIFPYPFYESERDHDPSFQGICAFRTDMDRLSVRPEGSNPAAQVAWGRLVSGNYFTVLGVQAQLGRTLRFDDDRPNVTPVAVMSYAYWNRMFNRDPSVVGRVFNIIGVPVTVVGVAPPEFFGESVEAPVADFWLPITLIHRFMPDGESPLEHPDVSWINLIGRLKPGVRIEQAQAGANVAFHQFLMKNAGTSLSAARRKELQQSRIVFTRGESGISYLRFRYSDPLKILMALVGLVLLIACANVANVLLSRSAARGKEISMRLALGASRGRLIRQLLTESLLLAALGALVGVVLASWGVNALVGMVSGSGSSLPLNVRPDAFILSFTVALSLLTGVIFGLVPALQATKLDLASSLKGGMSGSHQGARSRLAKILVVSQLALSLPLLVGAVLFVQTFQKLETQDLGFNHEQVLEVGINPIIAGYRTNQLNSLYRALLERVERVPGVRAASLSLYSPMSGDNWSGSISVEDYTPPVNEYASAQWVTVGPRYCETEGMRLLLGRDIGSPDNESAPRVAVVNESFVHRYLGTQYPIGRRFSMDVPAKRYDIEIVGVVKDFKFNEPRQEFWPVAFLPLLQLTDPNDRMRFAASLDVRTSGNPSSVAAAIRTAVQDVDRNLPITGVTTVKAQLDDALTKERLIAKLSVFFSLLSLVLASLGLYGVMSYAISRRTGEIGIRMAMGAARGDVARMVVRETLLVALIGVSIGVTAAVAGTRLIQGQLFGLAATDPVTISLAAAVMIAVSLAAGYMPARRASRVDPMVALRHE